LSTFYRCRSALGNPPASDYNRYKLASQHGCHGTDSTIDRVELGDVTAPCFLNVCHAVCLDYFWARNDEWKLGDFGLLTSCT